VSNFGIVKPTRCPTCGYLCDDATALHAKKETPAAGDVAVCINCAEILRFTTELSVEVVTLNDLLNISEKSHKTIETAIRIIKTRGKIE